MNNLSNPESIRDDDDLLDAGPLLQALAEILTRLLGRLDDLEKPQHNEISVTTGSMPLEEG